MIKDINQNTFIELLNQNFGNEFKVKEADINFNYLPYREKVLENPDEIQKFKFFKSFLQPNEAEKNTEFFQNLEYSCKIKIKGSIEKNDFCLSYRDGYGKGFLEVELSDDKQIPDKELMLKLKNIFNDFMQQEYFCEFKTQSIGFLDLKQTSAIAYIDDSGSARNFFNNLTSRLEYTNSLEFFNIGQEYVIEICKNHRYKMPIGEKLSSEASSSILTDMQR
ncbi:MAG: hypothetical protein PHO06_00355 [Clostridia bacterium]|nr:hypothetical protein [Clostridia bacterium]